MVDAGRAKEAVLAWIGSAEKPTLAGAARSAGISVRRLTLWREEDPEFREALNRALVEVGCEPYAGESEEHVERREIALDAFLEVYVEHPEMSVADAVAAVREQGIALSERLVFRQKRVNGDFQQRMLDAEDQRIDPIKAVAMRAAMDPESKGYSAALRLILPTYSADVRSADQARRGLAMILPPQATDGRRQLDAAQRARAVLEGSAKMFGKKTIDASAEGVQ